MAVLAAVLGLVAPPAVAGERIVGPGYAFDLPERFSSEAGPWEVVARATCETIVQGLPFRADIAPRMHFYSVPGQKGAEAVLVACRFDLRPENALTSVADLPPLTARRAYEHAMDTLPGGKLVRTGREQLDGYIPAEVTLFTYPHPSAGNRGVHSAIVVRERVGFLLLLDAPASLQVEYEAYFATIAASIRLLKPAPGLLEQMRYPIYGLVGLLALLLCASVTIRVRRATAQRRRQALAQPRMRVISVDDEHAPTKTAPDASAGDTAAAPDADGEPDAPGVTPPREFSPAAGHDLADTATTAPAAPARTGLRHTLRDALPAAEQPLEPSPAPTGARKAALEAAAVASTEDDEPEAPRSTGIRIQRNTDYL